MDRLRREEGRPGEAPSRASFLCCHPAAVTGPESTRRGRLWVAGAVGLLLAVLMVFGSGCGQPATDDDLMRARSVVQRVLFSSSYEDFQQGFTKKRRARMEETAIWIRWWQEKISKDRAAWAISSASDVGNGVIEVVVQHRRRPTSRQYYRLVRDGSTWAIQEIESER